MSYIEHLFSNVDQIAKDNRAEIDRYNKELEYAKANAGKEGFVSKPLTQYLIFKNENSAKVNITGNVKFITTKNISNSDLFKKEYVDSLTKSDRQPSNPTILKFDVPLETYPFVLQPNKSAIINYSGFTNATYDGQKISGLSLFLKNDSSVDEVVFAAKDPSKGLAVYNQVANTPINLSTEYQFIDDHGKAISFNEDKPAIIGISSLNHNNEWIETIGSFNFDNVDINGSAISKHGDKLYSTRNTDSVSQGSKYNVSDWDNYSKSLFYYGASAAVLKGDKVKYSIQTQPTGSFQYGIGQWSTFSSDIATFVIHPPKLQKIKPFVAQCRKPKCFNDCEDCCCQELVPNDDIKGYIANLRLKLENAQSYVCSIRNSSGRDTGEALSRFAYFTWCFLKNYINLLAYIIKKR